MCVRPERPILRLILSQHNSNCTVCIRSGNCELQKLSHDLNIHFQPYPVKPERSKINLDTPIVREASKCSQVYALCAGLQIRSRG